MNILRGFMVYLGNVFCWMVLYIVPSLAAEFKDAEGYLAAAGEELIRP